MNIARYNSLNEQLRLCKEALESLMHDLNNLDAQYLVGYPEPMSNSEYKERRQKLKVIFDDLTTESVEVREEMNSLLVGDSGYNKTLINGVCVMESRHSDINGGAL